MFKCNTENELDGLNHLGYNNYSLLGINHPLHLHYQMVMLLILLCIHLIVYNKFQIDKSAVGPFLFEEGHLGP